MLSIQIRLSEKNSFRFALNQIDQTKTAEQIDRGRPLWTGSGHQTWTRQLKSKPQSNNILINVWGSSVRSPSSGASLLACPDLIPITSDDETQFSSKSQFFSDLLSSFSVNQARKRYPYMCVRKKQTAFYASPVCRSVNQINYPSVQLPVCSPKIVSPDNKVRFNKPILIEESSSVKTPHSSQGYLRKFICFRQSSSEDPFRRKEKGVFPHSTAQNSLYKFWKLATENSLLNSEYFFHYLSTKMYILLINLC